MTYVRLTDAQTAYKHQWNQDDARQMRDNQDDADTRITQFLAQNVHSVIDDFFYATEGASSYTFFESSLAAADVLYSGNGSYTNRIIALMDSTGEHSVQFTTSAAAVDFSLQVKKQKCRLRNNQDMAWFYEFRAKDPGGTAPDNIFLGLQDIATANTTVESNVIAFLKGSTAGKWRFRVASGGVSTETDNIGNRAAWQKLRAEFLRSGSGSTLQVRAFIDGSEISGSPFTTNIPTGVVMKPFFGIKTPAAGTTDVRVDRLEMRWTAVPLAA
jgi:hypothetical protein